MHIALLIPAFNEERAMARTAAVVRQAIDSGIVTSATVLDGGSTDRTSDIATQAGIDSLWMPDVMPELGPVLGKGDSLFRGTRTIDADWYVFLDADLGNVAVDHIAALTAPVGREGIVFVKGGFVRIDENGQPREVPGGRVTEEVARPFLRRAAPELAELSQPLSGQVAIDGGVARSIGFMTGYAVEIVMLLDIHQRFGMAGIAEADMGQIQNRSKPADALDVVVQDIQRALWLRGLVADDGHPATIVLERR